MDTYEYNPKSVINSISSMAERVGLPTLVENFPAIKPLVNAIGLTKEKVTKPELPYTLTDENVDVKHVNPFYGFQKSTVPTDLPQNIKAYRGDPTDRFGGGQGLETLPINRFFTGAHWVGNQKFNDPNLDPVTSTIFNNPTKAVQNIYRYARLNGAAQKYGYDYIDPKDFATFVLKEGRSDGGFNGLLGGPEDNKFEDQLQKDHYIPYLHANYLAAIKAKKRIADKLDIPFAMAWNGTGVNEIGISGKDYAKDWEKQRKATEHPKNKALMDVINRGIEDGKKYGFPSIEDREKLTSRRHERVPYKAGGDVGKPIEGGEKII